MTIAPKLGLRLSGTVEVDDNDRDSDSGLYLGGFIDRKVTPNLYLGAFIDLSTFSVEDSDVTQFDIGPSVKWLIAPETVDFIFRPGIGLAYGIADIDDLDDKAGLFVANFFVEAIYDKKGSLPWLGEIGFTTSDGGTDDVDISNGPIFYIRGGLIF